MLANNCGVKVYQTDEDFEAWMGPADDLESDNVINAHIIGWGGTKDEALNRAQVELESTLTLVRDVRDLIQVVDIRRKPKPAEVGHDG